ncbi:proline--tRNA ligase [Tychonema sp. BBK16]|uniref:proline--tRNA ligase n=1 Tax=Tychonema sp. BBK16 TaxID=2699888 RepID=UPI001F0128B1|nr:proline--tRNA ligase [Tychonema sp. BBK16]MCF6373366.1 proline--tRNA ligase [Tychonema sp. BBK16]
MRLSQMLFVTLREDPAEAEIPSHKLLLRAGYIRRIGSGIYAYLPLMWRVLKKVSQIVREEMDATGAQECLLPQLQPADLWRESGRWDTYTQAEGIMFALTDRRDTELGLGPTHEEVITTIAKDMIRSYRQLPTHLYQIQTKFRDEIRPRFGLMRGREFIMKDGYSFHTNEESLKKTYQDMAQAYSNMLRRSGLQFRAVDADSGAIGGSGSQEFMVLAEAGEDEVLYTEDGQYAANLEKAVSIPADTEASPFASFEKRETPGTETIEKLCKFFKCSPTQVVKNVLYQAVYDSGITVLVLVSIRGDQDVNQVKLLNELTKLAGDYQAKTILFLTVPDAEAQQKWAAKSLPLGYMAPDVADDYIASNPPQPPLTKGGLKDSTLPLTKGGQQDSTPPLGKGGQQDSTPPLGKGGLKDSNPPLGKGGLKDSNPPLDKGGLKDSNPPLGKGGQGGVSPKFLRLVDRTAVYLTNFVTGSNELGYHVVGANWDKEFPLPSLAVDVRKAKKGDRAIHNSEQTLQTARGIEVGHIFQLGTKYSQAMGATYTNEQGEEMPLVMGCYGVGVSRLAQSAVEQSYDKDGIIWPVAIAPYHVIICIPNISDAQQVEVAEKLYAELNQSGIETLLDDRDERAGVKFKDADLIGIPYRIVTGRSLKTGKVEVVERATHKSQEIPIDEVNSTLRNWIEAAIK